ncbi:hypothetical protein C0585_00695, partial [Candidatus Woesearchaeota archaeon]
MNLTYENVSIVTTLNHPTNENKTIDFSSVSFNCSVTSSVDLENVTLYSDYNGTWQAIETKSLSGTSDSTTFTRNLYEDVGGDIFFDNSFSWNCLAYDSLDNNAFATSNYSFSSWNLGTNNLISINQSVTLFENNYTLDADKKFPDNSVSSGWFDMSDNILLYHMDESSGTITDYSDQSNDGSDVGGITYGAEGYIGDAISFDGVNDYISTGGVSMTGSFSVSVWSRSFTNIAPRHGCNAIGGGLPRIYLEGAQMSYGSSAYADATLYFTTGITDYTRWNHWVYMYNGTDISIYVNGEFKGSKTLTQESPSLNYVGVGPSIYFNGTIDEFAVWDKALTQEEINQIYKRQLEKYAHKGNYTSKVFDAGDVKSWNNLNISKEFPYGQELPSNEAVETEYVDGNINMTGNVLLLHMDESSGTLVDYSGQGNNGTQSGGVTYSSEGMFGSAINFDGSDDYINFGTPSELDIYGTNKPLTLSAWIKFDAEDTSGNLGDIIIHKGTYPTYEYGFATGGTPLRIDFRMNDAGSFSRVVDTESYQTGLWEHIVGVYNTTNVLLYRNGILVNSTSHSGVVNQDTYGLTMGTYGPSSSGYSFNGSIDEVAIWNRSLSADEVLDLYKRGALRLNISVRDCDDASCVGDDWDLTCTDATGCDLRSFTNSRYMQYKAELTTLNELYSPILSFVNLTYSNIDLGVYLNTPINNNKSIDFSNGNFNCSALSNSNLSNITLYSDYMGTWQAIETKDIGGLVNSTVFTRNLYDDVNAQNLFDNTFTWNCLAYKEDGNSTFATSNYTFSGWNLGDKFTLSSNGTNLQIDTTTQALPNSASESGWINMSGNVLLMNMDESSGNIIDYSGQGNDGTPYNGVIYSGEGQIDTAIGFDGSNDYIAVPDDNSLDIGSTGDLSISIWINSGNNIGTHFIMEKLNSYRTGYSIYIGTNNLCANIRNSSSDYTVASTSVCTSLLDEGNWNHFIATYDRDGLLKIYLNGEYKSSKNISDKQQDLSNTGSVNIGDIDGNYRFEGYLDEISMWNRALSEDEVATIYSNQNEKYAQYNSQVFDAGLTTVWTNLTFNNEYPYGQELPSNAVIETEYDDLNVNMTGNVLLLHMDESSGTIVDYSGQSNDGSVMNSVDYSVDGQINTAIAFDGTNAFINISDDSSLDITSNSITLSGWVYPLDCTGTGDGVQTIVTKQGTYYLNLQASTCKPEFYWYELSNPGYHVSNSAIPLNKWSYVVATYDGVADEVKLYVNGVNTLTVSSISGTGRQSDSIVVVGGFDSSNRNFNGSIDEVAIWNRTLSADEIMDIYKRGATKLNIDVRDCDDENCTGDSWDATCTDPTTCDLSNLSLNRYIQYKAKFITFNETYSPILNFVNLSYDPTAIVTTLNYPNDANNSIDFSSASFNCSVSSGVELENITLYADYTGTWQAIETKNVSGIQNSTVFTRNIYNDAGGNIFFDKSFNWNCLAYNNASRSDSGNSNRSFSGWDLGTYGDSQLNDTWIESGNTLVELPEGGTSDDWFDMSENLLLYHFDESSGTIEDTSGQNNDGTQSGGITYGDEGRINNAIALDGVDDYVSLTSQLVLDSDGWSVSWWMKRTEHDFEIIFWSGASLSGSINIDGNANGGGHVNNMISVESYNNNQWWYSTTTDNIDTADGEWHHYVLVFNDVGTYLYVDGIVDTTVGTVNTEGSWRMSYIGREQGGIYGTYFKGSLDEIAVWDRPLTSTEVESIYESQIGSFYSNYTSQVFDAGSGKYWNNVLWNSFPYGQELPSNGTVETSYDEGNINMTGNVLLLHMDESSGTIVDYSGQENNGTQSGGVTYSSEGMIGTALAFDGSDDYVNLSDNPSLDFETFTVSVWVNGNTYSNVLYPIFVSKWDGGASNREFVLGYHDTYDKFYFQVYNQTADTNDIALSNSTPLVDTWYHVVGLYDGTHVSIYINGLLNNYTSANYENRDVNLIVGSTQGGITDNAFNGTLDEVAIWDRSLSAEEISNLYKRGVLRLNVSVRDCNDDACVGDTWDIECTDAENCSITEFEGSRYVQYRAFLTSLDPLYSPILNFVNITYEPLFVKFTKFDVPPTTNFTEYTFEEQGNLCNVTLAINGKGRIDWHDCVNVSEANFDSYVNIGSGYASVTSSHLHSSLNSDANITLENIGLTDPVIIVDGSLCWDCSEISYSLGNYSFSVTHFSNYSLVEDVALTIFDESDPEGGSTLKNTGDQIIFFANYTLVNGTYLDDTTYAGNCSIEFYNGTDWTTSYAMNYNGASNFYEYTYSFDTSGTKNWNVTCNSNHPASNIQLSDTIEIYQSLVTTLNLPTNNYASANFSNTLFNCSAITNASLELTNMSLYANFNNTWQWIETKSLSGQSDSVTFTVDIFDYYETYIFFDNPFDWNCLAYDNSSDSDWGSSNFTFSGWNLGDYNNSEFNGSGVAIISPKGLPDNANENGWVNMTGNVLLYHMDESSGSIIDYSGLGNDGNESGGVIYGVTGIVADSIRFDGVDDFINASNDSSLNMASEGTWSAWLYLRGHRSLQADPGQAIIDKSAAPAGARQYAFQIRGWSSADWKKPTIAIRKSDDSDWVFATGSQDFPVGEWVYLVGVYDKAASPSLVLYQDGVQIGSDDTYHGDMQTGIGASLVISSSGASFNGSIDEVSIWNRSLSADEILQIYEIQSGRFAEYESKIFDAGSNKTWHRLKFSKEYPYGQELPSNEGIETRYSDGNFDMTGNIALYHMEGAGDIIDYSGQENDGTLFTFSNNGFESGTTTDATNWVESTNADRSSDKYYDGSWSMRFISPTTGQATYLDAISVTANTDYMLSGWVYNELSAGSAYLDLNDISEECQASSTRGNGAWEHVSCSFTTGSSTTSVRVRLVSDSNAGNTGDVWFDDVHISKGDNEGIISEGIGFDGIDNYFNIPFGNNTDASDLTNTFSMWIKSTNPTSDEIFLSSGQSPDADARIYVGYYNSNWDMGIYTSGWGTGNLSTNDEWNHVVLIMDGSVASLYINSILYQQKSYSSFTINEDFDLGRHPSTPGSYEFTGYMDEVAIWNRTLSEDEILDLYKRGAVKLNISVRVCNDSSCDGEEWNLTCTDPDTCSLGTLRDRYVQYKANFYTLNNLYTPLLSAINITHIDSITTTLDSPTNNDAIIDLSNVELECSAVTNNNLLNITLYSDYLGNWQKIETKSISGFTDTATFTKNIYSLTGDNLILDSGFKWNCLAYDDHDLSDWENTNYTFSSWDLGTYGNTSTISGSVTLTPNSTGGYENTTGTYTSQIFEVDVSRPWESIKWNSNDININLTVRDCDDAACSGDAWDITCTNPLNCNLESLGYSKYIQYKASFIGNSTYSPTLSLVNITYGELEAYCYSCSDCSSKLQNLGAGYTVYLSYNLYSLSTSNCINFGSATSVTFDCAGHTLDGDDAADNAVYISGSEQTRNLTVRNCIFTDWDEQTLYVANSHGNLFDNLTFSSCPDYDIYTVNSDYNTFSDIVTSGCPDGSYYETSNYNTFENNTLSSGYGFRFYNSDNNDVFNLVSNSNTYGMYINEYSTGNEFYNLTISNSGTYGIYLRYSSSNIFDGIYSYSDGYGLWMYDSDSNDFFNSNIVRADNYGMRIYYYSDWNEFYNVSVTDSITYGIYLDDADYTKFGNASLLDNGVYDVYIVDTGSVSNLFFNMTLRDKIHLYDAGSNTKWNNSVTGNWWLGYDNPSKGCFDDNVTDGFCDDPYELDANSIDHLPISKNISSVTYNCTSCSECTSLLQNNASVGDVVLLTADIVDYYSNTCIN